MSQAPTTEIALASPADVPTIGAALAAAFQDDPVLAWVVPDATSRRQRLPALFAAFAEAYLPHQETYIVADGAGAALWDPPESEPPSGDEAEAFAGRLETVLGEDAARALELETILAEQHPQSPCFYLQFLGVAPERQGSGLGSRLLTTVLRRCDELGTPAYLDASSERNRRLYERHDFRTVAEITLPQGPPIWPMWREPR